MATHPSTYPNTNIKLIRIICSFLIPRIHLNNLQFAFWKLAKQSCNRNWNMQDYVCVVSSSNGSLYHRMPALNAGCLFGFILTTSQLGRCSFTIVFQLLIVFSSIFDKDACLFLPTLHNMLYYTVFSLPMSLMHTTNKHRIRNQIDRIVASPTN